MEKRHKLLLMNPKQKQSEKPPAAKPFGSRWIPDEDNKPRVNVDYQKVPRQFIGRQKYRVI